jgi:WD40 repeat protein
VFASVGVACFAGAVCLLGLLPFLLWGLFAYLGHRDGAKDVPGKTVALARPELPRAINIPWLDAQQGIAAHIYQTGISADGKLFFGAGDAGPSGTIRLFNIATGRQVQELRPGGEVWFSKAAFVPGSNLVAAAYSQDKDIYLFDIATGGIVRKLIGHTDDNVGLAVAPDGKRLLSWGNDRTVRLWDVATGKERHRLEGHTDKAAGLFSPDSKQVLTFGPDQTLRLWDVETGKPLHKLEGHGVARVGAFSPDGKLVVAIAADETIRLWDMETGKERRPLVGANVKDDRDGARGFVASGRRVAAYCADQKFRLWDTANGRVVQEIDLADVGADRWSITPSPDGRLALVSHADTSVRVFDLASGKQIHSYPNCRGARSFSFTPDGTVAVAGSFRAGVYILRLPPGNR